MNCLVDAQLPRRLALHLRAAGHDAIHTLDLPAGNRTKDRDINDLSVRENRIVVTKDEDFVTSFFLAHRPHKLLLISTGNIRNTELEALLLPNMAMILDAFIEHDFIELTRTAVIVHR